MTTGRRILVTGARGFIGCPTVDSLRALGYDVFVVSRQPGPLVVDLLDPSDVERAVASVRPTHLLHLAWYTDHRRFWTAPENLRWLEASLHLVRVFAAHGGRRLVIAGSCAEYHPEGGVCVENQTMVAPASLYGASKHALNIAVSSFAPIAGLSMAWARLFNLFGPGEQPARIVPTVIRRLSQGEPVPCSDGQQLRDYLPVEEAARALAAVVDSAVEGPINIGSGDGITVRDLATRLADLIGSRGLLQFGALPRRAGEPDALVANIKRLTGEVGFTPDADLAAALQQTVSWWLSRRLRAI